MVLTMKHGIGRAVTVPVSNNTMARLSDSTVQEALQSLLANRPDDSGGTALAVREAAADPRSVIEVKTRDGYDPLEPGAPFRSVVKDRTHLDLLVSRPHAGG